MIRKKSTNGKRHLKDHLLRSFLVISIIFSVFLISNCDDLFNHIPIFPGGGGNSRPPEFGGDESESYITTLFKSVAEGAAGEIGGAPVSWAFSAIGLSDASGPDYSAQFDKIDQDLQEISNQLNVISNQLTDIYNELKVINCTLWSTNEDLGMAQSSIVGRMVDFQNLMGQVLDTTSPGDRLDINDLRDWVTSVLGDSGAPPQGQVAIATAMENLEVYLPGGPNGGVIPACVQAILEPEDNTFGTDTVYYNQVKLLLNYFYGYQVQALYLYSEAMHFRAWQNAGAPNSDVYSSDSVSFVCSTSSGYSQKCRDVINFTNFEYNTIIDQFTEAGAAYTDENFVLMYSHSNPYLWPKSLENFTTAAGDNCADPLTSAKPCGITADFYNGHSMSKVVFKGYSGWETAGTTLLTYLLADWSSGGATDYLQNKLGFQNMVKKIIISSNTVTVSLNESGSNQVFVPFFDTQWDYNTLPNGGGPARNEIDFQEGVLTKHRDKGAICGNSVDHYYIDVDYDTRSGFSFDPNGFYNAYSHARYCETNGIYYTAFSFSTWPGFLAEQNGTQNKNKNAVQFRMPVASLTGFTCTENRLNKNIGGVWTMCGDDFTAYLDFNVPRPSTCDNTHSSTPCQLSASAVATAKSVFGNKYKSGRSL